ncbi:recombinase family protein [Nocardioides glacieisoli]|uniref:recombinase family protein n=1 Tax=Nocardioides glacieisoli TaxID=1168730 RepID=UPI0030F3F40F
MIRVLRTLGERRWLRGRAVRSALLDARAGPQPASGRVHHGRCAMSALLVGYARCSTDQQDLTAQRDGLLALGVEAERIYVDHGLTAIPFN